MKKVKFISVDVSVAGEVFAVDTDGRLWNLDWVGSKIWVEILPPAIQEEEARELD